MARDLFAATAANRRVGIVANFTSCKVGHVRIKQRCQSAQDAAFGLSAKTEQNEIVARQNCIHDLRHNGVFVSNDPRKDCCVIVLAQAGNEVVAEFVFHAAGAQTFFRKWTAAQFAERAWKTHEEPPGKYFSGLYAVPASAFCRASLAESLPGDTEAHRVGLTNVAVPSGLLAGAGSAMEIGNEGFKIGDEDGETVGLGA